MRYQAARASSAGRPAAARPTSGEDPSVIYNKAGAQCMWTLFWYWWMVQFKFTSGDSEMGEQYEHEHKLDGNTRLLDIFLCVTKIPQKFRLDWLSWLHVSFSSWRVKSSNFSKTPFQCFLGAFSLDLAAIEGRVGGDRLSEVNLYIMIAHHYLRSLLYCKIRLVRNLWSTTFRTSSTLTQSPFLSPALALLGWNGFHM